MIVKGADFTFRLVSYFDATNNCSECIPSSLHGIHPRLLCALPHWAPLPPGGPTMSHADDNSLWDAHNSVEVVLTLHPDGQEKGNKHTSIVPTVDTAGSFIRVYQRCLCVFAGLKVWLKAVELIQLAVCEVSLNLLVVQNTGGQRLLSNLPLINFLFHGSLRIEKILFRLSQFVIIFLKF